MRKTGIAMLLIAGAMVSADPAEAQVSVNINIGPPPVIFAAPPRVLVVPHTPVYYAPDTTYNVFFYEGRYYSFHNGGAQFAFADGSVRFLSERMALWVLASLTTRSGGEAISAVDY
jgi:prepilin-type processing-associated H-X9-DG protein